MPESADVVIIGAGPTGCAAATYLARGGADVLLVDRHDPPAPAVGESLLPVCAKILEELDIDMSGFLVKRGAVFARNGQSVRFDFADAMRVEHDFAWQTPREDLDQRMRHRATTEGARFLHARVTGVQLPGRVLTDGGEITCKTVVDAGGRGQFLARTLGLQVRHPVLKNAAQGTWFTGVKHASPEEPGDVTICAFDGGWFWFVPFADGRCSVGCVTTPAGPKGSNRFEQGLQHCPDAARRLEGAVQVGPFRGASDISVSSTAFHGDGWVLLGDAATFLDPIFSTGISLGLYAAKGFATAYLQGESLDPWEQSCRDAVSAFEPVVASYYSGAFLDIALADRSRQQETVRKAIVSLLAGDVFDPSFTPPKRFGARLDSIHRMVTG